MDFTFATYNQIREAVNSANIMQYTLIGGQAVACTWVIVKFIYAFVKDTYEGQNKMTNMINTLGLVFFIAFAPSVIDILDNTFASIEGLIQEFKGSKLNNSVKSILTQAITSTTEGVQDKGVIGWVMTLTDNSLSDLMTGLLNLFLGLLGYLLWAVDSAIFAIFYTERLIVMELYRFIFPLFVAFVGFDGLRNQYYKWVMSFIGILILPIPYIAVHTTVDLISDLVINQNKSEFEAINVLITIVVLIASIGMKYKILSQVGKKVSQILS